MSIKNLKDKCASLLSGQIQYCTDIVKICSKDFNFLSYLGEGGETLNFKIQNTSIGNRIEVLKIPRPDLSKRALKKFPRQYEILVSLNNNRSFPIIYNVNTEYKFITMEYVQGTCLKDYMNRADISIKDKLSIFTSCCEAVRTLHENGSYHRDIKPENIMIRTSGEPCLIDFGLAKSTKTNTLTRTGDTLGTTFYMSPEQVLDSSNVDFRTDIFSLGRLLYFLLTNDEEEFESDMVEQIDFIPIINCSCEINVNERYQNITELISDIDYVIDGESIEEKIPELKTTKRIERESVLKPKESKILDVIDAFTELFLILGGSLYKVQKYTGISNEQAKKLLSCSKKRMLSRRPGRFCKEK